LHARDLLDFTIPLGPENSIQVIGKRAPPRFAEPLVNLFVPVVEFLPEFSDGSIELISGFLGGILKSFFAAVFRVKRLEALLTTVPDVPEKRRPPGDDARRQFGYVGMMGTASVEQGLSVALVV
jgi:hypothetical protein